jgi:hypothetical protein
VTVGSTRMAVVRVVAVFISYRRGDSVGHTGRLRDRLVDALGSEQVFRDLDSIPPGVDFRAALAAALDASDVLLAVIGPRWLSAADEVGQRRIEDPQDLLRIEIATALAREDVRVVPVLVEQATMPHVTSLPEDLRSLTQRQTVTLRDDRWDDDVAWLLTRLGASEGTSGPDPARGGPRGDRVAPRLRRLRPVHAVLAGVAVLAAAGLAAYAMMSPPDPSILRFNFQPLTAVVPDGYLLDAGDAYGDRERPDQGNGLVYGWVKRGTDEPMAMMRHARERDAPTLEQRKRTLIHMRRRNQRTGDIDEASWELEVDDGWYYVEGMVGDPEGESTPSTHTLLAEDVELVVGFQSHGSQTHSHFGEPVRVTDGKLTLSAGEDAEPKLNYVLVKREE